MKRLKLFNIFESKLEDFSFDDVYTKDYFENNLLKQDIIRDYHSVYEEKYSEASIKSEEFKTWLLNMFYEIYNKFQDDFLSETNYLNGVFEIYRVITVNDEWLEHIKTKGKHLGIYWSWDSDIAEAHNGDFKKKI